MISVKSFTKYYWLGWGVLALGFVASSVVSDVSTNLGWFAFISCLSGAFVFHFEFGRLEGFLKVHVPSVFAKWPNSWSFETFAFFNPTLLRLPDSKSSPEYNAFCVYRSAWGFSAVSMTVPLLINWTPL